MDIAIKHIKDLKLFKELKISTFKNYCNIANQISLGLVKKQILFEEHHFHLKLYMNKLCMGKMIFKLIFFVIADKTIKKQAY